MEGGRGPAEALTFRQIPIPDCKKDEVLVKIRAFGLNRMDIIQREGRYTLPPQAPITLGVEFSGTITSGDLQLDFQVGDEVFGLAYGGAYAEFIAVSVQTLIKKPSELSWEEAAGIPETWMTALQAMYLVGDFAPQKSILWHAGASAVAIAGTQLSQSENSTAIFSTVGSDDKVRFCIEQLGVTAAFNYKKDDWAQGVLDATKGCGVDVIIDLVGASHFQGNIKAAAKDARIAHLGQVSGTVLPDGTDIGAILWKRIRFEGSTLRSRDLEYQGRLKALFVERALPRIECGQFKIHVEKTFPWTDIVQAHKLLESNTTQGKIVCTIN